MQDMLDFIFHSANLPFLISLGLMLGLGVVELASLLMGGSLGALSETAGDVDLDVDFDLDPGMDVDADLQADIATDLQSHQGIDASGSILQQSLAWLHLGKLPLMIILVLAFFSFGSTGLLTQSIVSTSTGHMLPWLLASIPSFIVMVLFVRFAGLALLKCMPQDETQVVSSRSFVGKEAMMVIGTAIVGRAAQAKLRDEFGRTHYIMVQPRDENVELTAGTRILIISKHQTQFRAIIHPLAPVSKADGDAAVSK